jgi:hypothetical protein
MNKELHAAAKIFRLFQKNGQKVINNSGFSNASHKDREGARLE